MRFGSVFARREPFLGSTDKAQDPQPNTQADEKQAPQKKSLFGRILESVATKSSQTATNLKTAISNPGAVAKTIFTKQNIGEMALSAAVMATAKATVLATTAAVSAPVVAVYAATVATGGLVGGSLRTWREWRKSRGEAQKEIQERAEQTPDVFITDAFTRAANQGYWEYALEEKRLLKNVAKSAFTTAAGGAIGVAAHGLFETLQHGFGAQEAKTAIAAAPVAVASQEMMPSVESQSDAPIAPPSQAVKPAVPALAPRVTDLAPKADGETVQSAFDQEAGLTDVSQTSAATETSSDMSVNSDGQEMSSAQAGSVSDTASQEALSQDGLSDTPPQDVTSLPENTVDAPSQSMGAVHVAEPDVIQEETTTAAAPSIEETVDDTPSSAPVVSAAPAAPVATAAPLLPQDVAAQCMVSNEDQTISCVARDTGNIGTGEKLRMLFGAAKTPVDFVNGGPTTDAPSFIQNLRGFVPFQDWLRASAPAPAQPSVN